MKKVFVNSATSENAESMSMDSWANTDIAHWEFPSEEEAKSFFQKNLELAKAYYAFVEEGEDGYSAWMG